MAIHAAMVDRMDQEIGRLHRAASQDERARQHGHLFLPTTAPAPRSWSAATATMPTPRPARRTRFCASARLVARREHAVPPPQDLGPRRRHLHAAHRALAGGHRGARRSAARRRPRHRPRADDPETRRRQMADDYDGQPRRPRLAAICPPVSPATRIRIANSCGGCTKATGRSARAIGNSSPRATDRGSCTISNTTAWRITISPPSIPTRCASLSNCGPRRRQNSWSLQNVGNETR